MQFVSARDVATARLQRIFGRGSLVFGLHQLLTSFFFLLFQRGLFFLDVFGRFLVLADRKQQVLDGIIRLTERQHSIIARQSLFLVAQQEIFVVCSHAVGHSLSIFFVQCCIFRVPVQKTKRAHLALFIVGQFAFQQVALMLQHLHLFFHESTLQQAFQFRLFLRHFIFCSHLQFVDFLRNVGINLCAREFFQQLTLLRALRFEEIGKTTLRQQHRARELCIVQSRHTLHLILRLRCSFGHARHLAFGRNLVQIALHRLVSVVARQTHFPTYFIGATRRHRKAHNDEAFFCPTTQISARVLGTVHPNRLFLFLRQSFLFVFQTRSGVVECQTYGIEQTTLAGSCVARYGKKTS